jgi:predicted transcriptional regulator of viral defense system
MSQRQIAHTVLTARGISRLAELREAGATAATMSRMERDGEVLRLARGLYQLPTRPSTFTTVSQRPPNGFPKASFASFRRWLFMV